MLNKKKTDSLGSSETAIKKIGRPSTVQDGVRYSVYLPEDLNIIAKALGGGNISKGVRFALGKAKRYAK